MNKITTLFKDFTGSEKNAGLILVFFIGVSLLFANLNEGESYIRFWHQHIDAGIQGLDMSIEHWINDGLMTIFFLLVGLEIERELYIGELHPFKNALLPLAGALGGMLMPALIYFLFNVGQLTLKGFGIPMGTDIAFALAFLALAGKRIPHQVKVLLTAIAIIDDLGSILVIAIFYGNGLQYGFLSVALGIFVILLIFNRLKINAFLPYLLLGLIMWYCMLRSGIHPSISGVLLAFAFPFRDGSVSSPSYKLQRYLHLPVAYLILPIFVLANTAISVKTEYISGLLDPHSLGIGFGLLFGKPVGILLAVFLMVKSKLVTLPEGISRQHLVGMGCIAGTGFTMSIFITQLAFADEYLLQSSKIMILLTSLLAGSSGLLIFFLAGKKKTLTQPD